MDFYNFLFAWVEYNAPKEYSLLESVNESHLTYMMGAIPKNIKNGKKGTTLLQYFVFR